MLTSFADPIDDRVFLVPCGPYQAANPVRFRDERQSVDDFTFWRTTAIEERSFGFCERRAAGLAQVSLPTGVGLPKLVDVALFAALKLTIV